MKLVRRGEELTGYINGIAIGPFTVSDPEMVTWLQEPLRFKLYGWQGGSYTISEAVLSDGHS